MKSILTLITILAIALMYLNSGGANKDFRKSSRTFSEVCQYWIWGGRLLPIKRKKEEEINDSDLYTFEPKNNKKQG
jgi:hypothetical protein